MPSFEEVTRLLIIAGVVAVSFAALVALVLLIVADVRHDLLGFMAQIRWAREAKTRALEAKAGNNP